MLTTLEHESDSPHPIKSRIFYACLWEDSEAVPEATRIDHCLAYPDDADVVWVLVDIMGKLKKST